MADNFGVTAYAICLFFLTILWSTVWGDATACPYSHMEDMLEGKTSLRIVALKTWAQIMGGCCVYRFVQVFWWFELAQTHEGRAFESCTADLQASYGFLLFTKYLVKKNYSIYLNFIYLGESIFGCIH